MAKNQSTYTLKIDAELGNLQKTLNEAKNSLSNFMSSGQAPKGLERAFEKINNLLGQISDKTGKPLDLKGLTGTGKNLEYVQESFRSIIRMLGEFDDLANGAKLSFVSEDERKRIEAASKAMQDYEKIVTATAEKIKQLEGAKKTQQKNESSVKKIEKNVEDITSKKTKKEASLETRKGKLAAMESLGDKADPIKIAELRGKINELQGEIKELEEDLKGANRELTEAQKAFNSSSLEVNALSKEVDGINKGSLKQLKEEAKKLGISLEGLNGRKAADQMAILVERFKEFEKEATKGGQTTFNNIKKGFEDAGESAEEMGKSIAQATEEVKQSDETIAKRDAFESRIKQFLGLQGATQVLHAALRDAVQTVSELDATMTEMAVVTDLTVGDYWDQLPQYSKQASELGVSINSAYKAATLYYQQGLKGNEVSKISAETLKMAKIAGLDAADATDKMTAALRGFNMELNEASAQKVADVYSQLAAITAADVDEISSAMTKTASIASSAGMEFETTAAFLSQIIETTRESAETAGTAMKTVIARFQELKKAPGEIGEIEGEIVDANAIETALRSVGVSLRDANGQFRELDDVFLELSSKWSSLDKNTQRYIATIAAGSRQQSRFIAMMSDYGRTQELVTSATNSAGASQKQFEKTTESLEYKVEQLKNAWHEFTMGIMNSDLVKFGVDVLTKLLEIVNKATSAFNGLGGSIVKIASVIAVFKMGQKIFTKLKGPMISFFADIVTEASKRGKEAAEAFDKSARSYKNPDDEKKENSDQLDEKSKQENEQEKKSIGQTLADKTGITELKEGFTARKNVKNAREKVADIEKRKDVAKARKDNATENFKNVASQNSEDSKEFLDAQQELNEATKEYENIMKDADQEQKKMMEAGYQGSQQIASGLSKAGQAAMGLGVAFSALGGILSSVGLETAGTAITYIGNGLMILGSVLMALPPIITFVAAVAKKKGIEVQTAWGWIGIILGGIALLVTGVIALFNHINNNSPEKKLENAAKALESAKETATQTAEKYQTLVDSLDKLNEKYDSLDNLTEGTKEWNKAVQDVNASVLGLIEKYPELAGLVENEGGVLKLDIESDEVQDVINKYEGTAALAKSVEYSAQAKVTQAQQQVNFSNLEAVDELSALRGWKAAGQNLLFSPGGVAGMVAEATLANADTHTDEKLQSAIESLSTSVLNGITDTNYEEMKDFLVAQGLAADEAALLAEEFAKDTESLVEFGNATKAAEAAVEAQYSAMAMQAKQMINLSKYSADEQEQMSNAVNAEMIKGFEDARTAELMEEYEGSNSDEFEQMKDDFAKEMYGPNARVDGDQILNEKGEVIREFSGDEEFAQAIAAAQATKEAAEAMEKIPNIIDSSAKAFESRVTGAGESFEKLFLGNDGNKLTTADIQNLEKAAADPKVFEEIWKDLSPEEQKIYGTREKFQEEYNNRIKAASDSLNKSQNRLTEVNKTLVLNKKLTAEAADAWVKNLEKMKTGGASDKEITSVSTELDKVLQGLTEEQAAEAMAQINAIDQMDISSWEGLADTFEELGLMANINKEALDNFIKSGIEASNAIRKINFDTLSNDINNTYKLLDKIKEGGRTYSESDYKELIAANKSLEKSFMQIGDEFIYMGGSMGDLMDAVEKNTTALLGEANRQLQSKQGMANIIDSSSDSYGSVEYMSEYQAMNYLTEMRSKFQSKGFNIEDFGIQGLSNTTDFSKATAEQLKDWAAALASEGNNTSIYSQKYAEKLREANIQKFSHNDAAYNAQMAATKGEYADEHQEALVLQAIQSGAVNNSVIEAYKKAIKENNSAQIESIGEQIAKDIDKVIEQDEGRDAFNNLVDRVAKAIEEASRKEIDKLSQLNDAINEANAQLIAKIQEQINEDRANREQEKAEKNLTDLQSQQAYLMMDTSGMNTLESQTLTENIADAEQQLQDSLIDQSLQNLQDANDAAAQQRERQIMIAEQQLENDIENGRIMEESTAIVTESIEALKDGTSIDKTIMAELLKDELADSEEMSNTIQKATQAANWFGRTLAKPKNTGAIVTELAEDQKKANEADAKKAENEQKTKNALATGKSILESVAKGGFASQDVEGSELDKAFKDYNAAANAYNETVTDQSQKKATYNTREEFAKATGVSNIHQHDFKDIGYINYEGNNFDFADALTETDDGEVTLIYGEEANLTIKGTNSSAATAARARGLADGRIFKYSGGYYIYKGGQAYVVMPDKEDYDSLKAYAGGGLANFTGPAWLDGTKSRPEYVLNADQTERFFSLVDVLEHYDQDSKPQQSGDNYFEIEINVEKLENDYDVEQVANKIRKIIYEDAMYRNVNAINNMR